MMEVGRQVGLGKFVATATICAYPKFTPVPFHPFGLGDDQLDPVQVSGYGEMERLWHSGELGLDFVWCANVGMDVSKLLYVDAIHYSPLMSDLIAHCIVANTGDWFNRGKAS